MQLEIATHPILVEQLEESVLDALGAALESHRHALGLNPNDANTLFNASQVLAGIAEAVANDDLPQQALGLLQEAIGMQNKCLEIQEAEYAETLDMERKAQDATSENGSGDPNEAQDSAPVGTQDTGDASDEQWATIVEAVTLDTLVDTALAQLSAMTTFSDVLSSNPECAPASILSEIDKHWSGLEQKLAILSTKLPERSQELALARATFLSALLEAGFRYGQIDGETYSKGRDAAFGAVNLQSDSQGSVDAIIANMRSVLAFNAAVSDLQPADLQLATLRWNALTGGIAGLSSPPRRGASRRRTFYVAIPPWRSTQWARPRPRTLLPRRSSPSSCATPRSTTVTRLSYPATPLKETPPRSGPTSLLRCYGGAKEGRGNPTSRPPAPSSLALPEARSAPSRCWRK